MINIDKTINALLKELTPRQQEIIVGRFGLKKSQEPQTLAALGEKYDITRERVRQIEASALDTLKKQLGDEPAALEILSKAQKYLKSSGGVARKETVLKHLATSTDGLTENHLALLLEASGTFHFHSEDTDVWPFYYLDKSSLRTATQFIEQLIKFLKPKKEEILNGKFREHLGDFLKKEGVHALHAEHFLAISKKIHTSPYGDTGLAIWPEIKPQTIRDRIYLILKKKSQPLHFRAIAKHINEIDFSRRTALVPTVHNELIKDPRFVLVGRGIYALSEQGYEPGTAREIIQKILRKQGSLSLSDIVLTVQKERFFKQNTILANLQNKNHFKRLDNGTYQVKES